MTDETKKPDVRITAPTEVELEAVQTALGNDTIWRLALAARRCDVMISLTVSPYAPDATASDATDDVR